DFVSAGKRIKRWASPHRRCSTKAQSPKPDPKARARARARVCGWLDTYHTLT
ncbi:hypothetical protein KSS87_011425, partial [Heliosperma pusillum]